MCSIGLFVLISFLAIDPFTEARYVRHQSESRTIEDGSPCKPKVRVNNEGRILINGLCDPTERAAVYRNVEYWLRGQFKNNGKPVRISILPNGRVRAATGGDLRLQQQIKDFVFANKKYLFHHDFRRPPGSEKTTITVTKDGRILIQPTNGPLYNLVKKQIETYLRQSNIVDSVPNLLTILPDGQVFVEGTLTTTQREKADRLVKAWLLQNNQVFNNYDPNNPPRVKNVVVSIDVSDRGQICVKTMDEELKAKVQHQIIAWIRASLPALRDATISFGSTGEPIISDPSQLEAVEKLLITNRRLLKKFNPNQPLVPQKPTGILVDADGRVMIHGPEASQSNIKEQLSNLLTRILPADNATLMFLDDGRVAVLESQVLTEFVQQFLLVNKQQIESFNLDCGFPDIPTQVNASVTTDGKLTVNGPQVLTDKFVYDLQNFLQVLLPSVNLTVSRMANGLVEVEGDEEMKLQQVISEFYLNNRDLFKNFNISDGFSKVMWSVAVYLDEQAHLRIEGPEPLRQRVKQDLQTRLQEALGQKISLGESKNGSLVLPKEVENLLQQDKEALKDYDPIYGFRAFRSPTKATVEITVLQNYKLDFQGPDELVRTAKTDLIEWLKSSLRTLLDSDASINVTDNGRVHVSGANSDGNNFCLTSLIDDFLWSNKAAVESYNAVDGFPVVNWTLKVVVTPENAVQFEGPTSVVKLIKKDFEEWLRSLFPTVEPSVTFVLGSNGKVEVEGSKDSNLIDRLEKLVSSALVYYKQELTNFQVTTGFPEESLPPPIAVTPNGTVVFAGPFASQVKQDLVKWIRLHLSELERQIEIDFLDNGEVVVFGTDEEAEKKALKDLIQGLLQDTRDMLTNLDIVNGLPKNIGWHLTITISSEGHVKFEGSQNLIVRVRQDLAEWLKTQLCITDLQTQINVPLEGEVTVTGTADKELAATLEQMIKDFLQNNKDKIERYDIVTGFPDAEWSVNVTVDQNGSFKCAGPAVLIAKVKQDLVKWIRTSIPVLDPQISITISEMGAIEVGGANNDDLILDIREFLEQNVDKLKDYNIVTGFPKAEKNKIPKISASETEQNFSIALQQDGRFVFQGPPLVVAKAKHDLIAWLTKYYPTGNVSFSILEDGEVDVLGAETVTLREDIKQEIKSWFLNNTQVLHNYDVVKGFPDLELKATAKVEPDGTLRFSGSPLLVAKLKMDLVEWLSSFLPETEKKIEFTLLETGEVDVNGDVSLAVKESLRHQVKAFLLANKSTVQNYDVVMSFTDPAKPKTSDILGSPPANQQATDNQLLSVTTNQGKVIFQGPVEQQEHAKNEFLNWFLNSFSDLPPGVSLKFDKDGSIKVTGTQDELLKGMLKTNIEELVVAHQGEIENYRRTRTLPAIIQRIPALIGEREQLMTK